MVTELGVHVSERIEKALLMAVVVWPAGPATLDTPTVAVLVVKLGQRSCVAAVTRRHPRVIELPHS